MAEAGADLIMLEMMVYIDRMCVLIEASHQTGLPVWVGLAKNAFGGTINARPVPRPPGG